MFFKFNNFSGRIAPTNVQAAYTPQGLAAKVEASPEFKFSSAHTRVATVPDPRPVQSASATGGGVPKPGEATRGFTPNSAGYRNLMAVQEKYATTAHDGIVVWQKFGRDKGIYLATLGLAAVGSLICVQILWKMSWPKPVPEE